MVRIAPPHPFPPGIRSVCSETLSGQERDRRPRRGIARIERLPCGRPQGEPDRRDPDVSLRERGDLPGLEDGPPLRRRRREPLFRLDDLGDRGRATSIDDEGGGRQKAGGDEGRRGTALPVTSHDQPSHSVEPQQDGHARRPAAASRARPRWSLQVPARGGQGEHHRRPRTWSRAGRRRRGPL
jgi:hypothetical protein